MSRKRKWIAVDSPHEPATRVARRALKSRLRAVWDYLPRAAKNFEDDDEFVHQLRVSSRRAVAAVEMFEAFLPPRRAERIKNKLKKIRQAAGDARDLDVLAARLKRLLPNDSSGAAQRIREQTVSCRRAAQPAICDLYERLRGRYKRRVKNLCRRIRLRDERQRIEPEFIEVARQSMRETLNQFFSAGQANLADPARLHLFRISGKQVRYAMEIFAGAFPAGFVEQLYPQIVELQEKLGDINDHVTALTHFENWRSQLDSPDEQALLARLIVEENKARDDRIAAFLQFWSADRSERLRYQFARALGEGQISISPASLPVAESG